MSHLVNLMTKHLTPTSRIQYIVSDGGHAPNVAPDTAEIYYYCRHAEVEMVRHNWDRIVKASEAAALGTSTRVEHEVIHGLYPLLPNETLSRIVDANLRQVGGVTYSPEELEFAKKIRETFSTSKICWETESRHWILGKGLRGRGWNHKELDELLGGSWLRVYKDVWGA